MPSRGCLSGILVRYRQPNADIRCQYDAYKLGSPLKDQAISRPMRQSFGLAVPALVSCDVLENTDGEYIG